MSEAPEIKVRRFSRDKRVASPPTPPPSLKEEEDIPEIDIAEDDSGYTADDDSFLSDLKGEQLPSPEEVKPQKEEEPKTPPPSPKPKKERKQAAIKKTKASDQEFGDLFGEGGTPILGKDRRELLTKIQEYKCLFPEELKKFKVKPKASIEDLQAALNECEVIVSCSSGMSKMLDESILSVISVLESVSSRTENWDISGTAMALRENTEFRSLAKRLYLKHRLFADVPVEGQLALLVVATAMTMKQVNMKKKRVSSLLSQEI